jgi:poly-beta-1,6-N-acetyl-D-glucosamine synthase
MTVWIFWLSLGLVAYAYAGYPLLLTLWAQLRPRPLVHDATAAPSVVVVVVGFNEGRRIGAKIESCLAQTYRRGPLRVLVASDGSTDDMGAVVASYASRGVTWLPFAERRGKAACLNDAAAACHEEVIVFTDARQRLHPEAVERLVNALGDRRFGAVSGELVFESDGAGGFAAGIDAYWRYEKYIRRQEAATGSVIGVTGALYAIRRASFRPIPVQTILDDVAIPMQVVMQGQRVGFEAGAIAYDRPSTQVDQERLRKVRTLAGNFQLIQLFPSWILPVANPVWLAFFSHKLTRLLAPFAMATGLLANVVLSVDLGFYAACLVGQLLLGAAAWAGRPSGPARSVRVARLAHAFLTLNAFVVLGLIHFLRHRDAHLWSAPAAAPAAGQHPLTSSKKS